MSVALRPAPSLRRQLLWLVLAAIALVSVLQAGTAYRNALAQADAMFDEHLRELARSVQYGVPLFPGSRAPSVDLQVQIWTPDGVQVFRSVGPVLPAQALLGFSDIEVEGTHYRVYALQTPEHTIQVAQNRDARQAVARGLAWRAVLPVALLTPLLMAAVWWLINQALSPVERMRRQVAARPADDLSALPEAGLPEEVLPLVRELNLLFERVRGAFDAQRHFVADAAHELRSPLAALKLQAQAVRRGADDASRDAAVQRLESGIERSIRLVTQMLVLARAEADAPGDARPVELQQLAREAVAEVLPQAHERRIDVGLATEREAQVRGRHDALLVLLRNLLENAVKYAPEGGRVDIAIEPAAGGGVALVVEDNGPGIAEAERARVFDRFYRTPDATGPGSGLGLAIVRTVAERHGATVDLGRSERLGGLRVEVRFPAA
ncbi:MULTISPECIES: ATP-binding protein [Ramlibacter]|uniref:histidine kinase n=1 Tax=Ramlibacter pinisoli TaxID=2682844 RepID=A0A6N8IZB7_9BURK|nr:MULTISPECIES: ATP-binding protein [Ramlibacter]MBA2961969.1 sensor histidine kinase N-terminal domain-containing protein [Ramlibacter sp. CGMCC 1.13660]MVQ31912.1 two-component sensor histidine kinase [Ramlibacter pinisoli]